MPQAGKARRGKARSRKEGATKIRCVMSVLVVEGLESRYLLGGDMRSSTCTDQTGSDRIGMVQVRIQLFIQEQEPRTVQPRAKRNGLRVAEQKEHLSAAKVA